MKNVDVVKLVSVDITSRVQLICVVALITNLFRAPSLYVQAMNSSNCSTAASATIDVHRPVVVAYLHCSHTSASGMHEFAFTHIDILQRRAGQYVSTVAIFCVDSASTR